MEKRGVIGFNDLWVGDGKRFVSVSNGNYIQVSLKVFQDTKHHYALLEI